MIETSLKGKRKVHAKCKVLDVIGVGLGPANLALAAALQEETEQAGGRILHRLFFEYKPMFSWHPNMLLEDMQMQTSFLKDLVTMRDPRSRFTFLNYLCMKGRLHDFINLREFCVTRVEFNNYYAWAAEQMQDSIRYGKEVLSVRPCVCPREETIKALQVSVRDVESGRMENYLTSNVVLATGGVPYIPQGIIIQPGGRVFHSHEFLQRLEQDFPRTDMPYRFLVIGSGQSAAEIVYYLLTHYRHAQVTAAFRQFAYKPADDSDFINELFLPHMVDFLYELPQRTRHALLAQHRDTNYAVVDRALIGKIYKWLYREKVEGHHRAQIMPFLELRSVKEYETGVKAALYNTVQDQLIESEADGIILATGYTRAKRPPLLDPLAPYLATNGNGYQVQRNYQIVSTPGFLPKVFLQGFCEETHGLSDTLLSILPIRAYQILQSLLDCCDLGRSNRLCGNHIPLLGK